MRAQRRERATTKLIAKQKIVSDQRRIQQALEKVRSEAEVARRSLHTKSGGVNGRDRDNVCSHATKSNSRPKVVFKQQTQLPFSDITNNFYDCSIGNTDRALCSETQATSTTSESVAAKNSVDKRVSTRAASHTEDAATDGNGFDVASSNSKLDTRREWELAPLQDALHRFALGDETSQEWFDANDLEFTFPSNLLRLKSQQSRERSGILQNRGLPIRAVNHRAHSHSAISLCFRYYTCDNYPRPHSGRKHKKAYDNYAPIREEHEAKIIGVAEDTNTQSLLSTSENVLSDEKLRSSSSDPYYVNPTISDNTMKSLQGESEESCYTFPDENEDAVCFIRDSNVSNEKNEESIDDEYESSFLSED